MERETERREEPPKPFYSRSYKGYVVVMTIVVLIAAAVLAYLYLSTFAGLDAQISG